MTSELVRRSDPGRQLTPVPRYSTVTSAPQRRLPVLPRKRWGNVFRQPRPEDYLGDNEVGLFCTRRHWIVPLITIIGSKRKLALSVMAGFLLMTIGWVTQAWWILLLKVFIIVVHQIFVFYSVLAWRRDVIVGSSRQLMRVRGVFTRTVNAVELGRIKERYIHRSLSGRMLGYGTLQVLATDGSENRLGELDYLPNPARVYRATLLRRGD